MILKSVPIAIQRAHCIKEEGGLHQNKLQYSQLRLRKKKMHSFFPFPSIFPPNYRIQLACIGEDERKKVSLNAIKRYEKGNL